MERKLCLSSDGGTLRDVSVISSARCFDFYGAWFACGSLDEKMESDCGGAWRMALCLYDGGDVGASAKPCLSWEPSWMDDRRPPWNRLDCGDAPYPYSNFSGASALSRA